MGLNNILVVENRIRQMLNKDRKENPNKMVSLLKGEIFYILRNYMDIKLDDIVVDIGVDNDGKYIININAEVGRMFLVNCLT